MGATGTTIRTLEPRRRTRGVVRRTELPSLAPRDVGALLDTAMDVVRERFGLYALLVTPLWVPVTILQVASLYEENPLTQLLATVPAILLSLVVQSLATGLLTVVVYGQLQGYHVPPGRALALGVKRAPALLAASVLTNVCVTIGMMCCFVPGIVLSWFWALTPAALMVERLGPIQAISRSARLVPGSFWRWAGLVVTQTILLLPFTSIAAALAEPSVRAVVQPASGIPLWAFDALHVVVASLLTGLATAFAAVVLTIFYLDIRVRTEGFDLSMRLERLRRRMRPTEEALP